MKDKIKYHQDQPEEIRKPSSSSQNDRPKFTGSSHITLESLLPALRQAKELSMHILNKPKSGDDLPSRPESLYEQQDHERQIEGGERSRSYDRNNVTPPFPKRLSYDRIPHADTEIISGDRKFIESPVKGTVDAVFQKEEQALHNDRWIAKRGKNLDGTGPSDGREHYSSEEQFEAAHRVVKELLTESVINKLVGNITGKISEKRNSFGKQDNPDCITVYIPCVVKDSAIKIPNVLPIAMAHKLTERLNSIFQRDDLRHLNVHFDDGSSQEKFIICMKAPRAIEHHSGADKGTLTIKPATGNEGIASLRRAEGDLLTRLTLQPFYYSLGFKKGDMVILADDHVQTGASLVGQYNAFRERGVEIVGMIALATMPEASNIQPSDAVLEGIDQAITRAADQSGLSPTSDKKSLKQEYKHGIEEGLAKIGLSIPTLTNREVLTVIAYILDGHKHDNARWFKDLAKGVGADEKVVERSDESVFKQLMESPISPSELAHMIDERVPKFNIRKGMA